MKVFKFTSGSLIYGYAAETEEDAKTLLFEDYGEMEIDTVEEIPQSKWDEKTILEWEDNDLSKRPFKVSIRDEMVGAGQVFTNDLSKF